MAISEKTVYVTNDHKAFSSDVAAITHVENSLCDAVQHMLQGTITSCKDERAAILALVGHISKARALRSLLNSWLEERDVYIDKFVD